MCVCVRACVCVCVVKHVCASLCVLLTQREPCLRVAELGVVAVFALVVQRAACSDKNQGLTCVTENRPDFTLIPYINLSARVIQRKHGPTYPCKYEPSQAYPIQPG